MAAVATRADAIRIKHPAAEIKNLHAMGTIPGAVVLAVAASNGPGIGHLASLYDGRWFAWQAPGSDTFGAPCYLAGDGTLLLEDGEDRYKWARIQVYNTYLTDGPAAARVLLADIFNNPIAYDDVTAAEASAGAIVLWPILIANDSSAQIDRVRIWLDPAVADLEISKTMPTFVAPDSENHVDVIIWDLIAPGSYKVLVVRRTIGAAEGFDDGILNHLHFAWDGF